MRRSPFRTSRSRLAPLAAAFTLACAGERGAQSVATSRAEPVTPGPPPAGFAFSHDNSREERWPFGLNLVTTKFVAEPSSADGAVSSYWVVRSEPGYAPPNGELRAEFRVRPEFPASAFEPTRGVEFEIVLGEDRNGAATRALDTERIEVLALPSAAARQRGFIVRARFFGDAAAHEPPKSLLVELLAVRDADGRELPLGEPRTARWLIVESAASAPPSARETGRERSEVTNRK